MDGQNFLSDFLENGKHNASRGIEDSKTELENTKKTVEKKEAKIAELKKTIGMGMAQDSALDAYFDNINLF